VGAWGLLLAESFAGDPLEVSDGAEHDEVRLDTTRGCGGEEADDWAGDGDGLSSDVEGGDALGVGFIGGPEGEECGGAEGAVFEELVLALKVADPIDKSLAGGVDLFERAGGGERAGPEDLAGPNVEIFRVHETRSWGEHRGGVAVSRR